MTSLPVIACTDEAGTPNCGACCQFIGAPPYMPHELRRLPLAIRNRVLPEWSQVDRVGPCPLLDGKGCSAHYEHKPLHCKHSMQPGDDGCKTFRRKAGLPA